MEISNVTVLNYEELVFLVGVDKVMKLINKEYGYLMEKIIEEEDTEDLYEDIIRILDLILIHRSIKKRWNLPEDKYKDLLLIEGVMT